MLHRQLTGNEYAYGCRQSLAWWLEPWTSTLAALCLFLTVANAVGIAATSAMKRYIRHWKLAEEKGLLARGEKL